jgi:hypothetical protein
MGIDASLLPKVFELFTQAERTPDRAQGGLGIGLALVRTMVNLHGGSVEATSPGPGRGSTFTIILPLSGTADQPERGDNVQGPGALANALDIMIVDDNLDAGDSLAMLLAIQGHQVRVETHPLSAMRAAISAPPQVFILDIGLPEIDGYEMTRRLRANENTKGALFIALTGYGQAHDRILSRAAGFAHHFVKPIDIEQLNRALADAST